MNGLDLAYFDNEAFAIAVVEEQAAERDVSPRLQFGVRELPGLIDITLIDTEEGMRIGNASLRVKPGEAIALDPFNEKLLRGFVNQMTRWAYHKPEPDPNSVHLTPLDFS